jgi:hypothetical protein
VVSSGDDGINYIPVGSWWLNDLARRQYEQIVFEPKRPPEFDGNLNLWQGFGVESEEGSWSLMKRHVQEVLASENEKIANYILRWAAWCIQNPDKHAEVSLVFRGGQGTGKGTFARALCDIFGQHAVHISSSSELVGRFNSHMRDCVFLFADEAIAPNDHDAAGKLKALITEPTIRIEPKGIDSQAWPNRLHVMMASNARWIVPADWDDRRFVVLDISSKCKEDTSWFKPLYIEMRNGGVAAMLYDLLRMPLGNWHPREGKPETRAHIEQKTESLKGADSLWLECLSMGHLPGGKRQDDGSVVVPSLCLLEWMQKKDPSVGFQHVSALLRRPHSAYTAFREGMGFEKKLVWKENTCYIIPPIAQARKAWDTARFPWEWDEIEEWSIAKWRPPLQSRK